MKDEEIAEEAKKKGQLLQPKKADPAVNYLGELLNLIPAAHQDLVINIALALVGLVWLVDVITPDPLPLLDEAGLTYLLFLLYRLKQSRS